MGELLLTLGRSPCGPTVSVLAVCSSARTAASQAFDGLALGSAFVRAGFSRAKYCLFAALFVLVTPFGIAIGIGVSQSYAPGSKGALATEAAFNSISAGEAVPLVSRKPLDAEPLCNSLARIPLATYKQPAEVMQRSFGGFRPFWPALGGHQQRNDTQ